MVNVYLHFLNLKEKAVGIFNAGFENMSILEIARKATSRVPAEIIITPSNDPRSYRLNSDKLLSTGFTPKFTVDNGIEEIIKAYTSGMLHDEERWHNIKTMKQMDF
jgi:nucleoside-diphosphate-sugar epimerase